MQKRAITADTPSWHKWVIWSWYSWQNPLVVKSICFIIKLVRMFMDEHTQSAWQFRADYGPLSHTWSARYRILWWPFTVPLKAARRRSIGPLMAHATSGPALVRYRATNAPTQLPASGNILALYRATHGPTQGQHRASTGPPVACAANGPTLTQSENTEKTNKAQ